MSRRAASGPAGGARCAFPVVGLGASAGGVEAFNEFLSAMPAASGMAFVFVLHLDPERSSVLTEILARHTTMPVTEVTHPVQVVPDHVYVIAPNCCLEYQNGRLVPREPETPRWLRKPIDVLLRSLARSCGARAIGVVFSGGGSDGTLGLKDIRNAGGLVLVQTPETAMQDSMPTSAIDAGLDDHVLAISAMPAVLIEHVQHRWHSEPVPPEPEPAEAEPEPEPEDADREKPDLEDVLALLRARQDFDFRCYKKGMLARRVQRRMSALRLRESKDYLALLQRDSAEFDVLAADLMISVTQFFRNPQAWDHLAEQVLPELCELASAERPLRAWVPACASGEEVYSLAILLLERLLPGQPHIQLFASDSSEAALNVARTGLYPDSITAHVTPARLARFFRAEGTRYRVIREVRDCVTFAVQNLINDPPFGRIDLISCRNFMIYLEPEMQERMLALFHFALRPGGYLFLGNVESIGGQFDLFEPVSHKWRVYRRIGTPRLARDGYPPTLRRPSGVQNWAVRLDAPRKAGQIPAAMAAPELSGAGPLLGAKVSGIAGYAQQIVLERYTRACVLVNRRYEILYFFGPTHEFLRQPVGEHTADLFAWTRDGLRSMLRSALHEISTTAANRVVRQHAAEAAGSGDIECIVEALRVPRELDGLLLIAFTRLPVVGPPPREVAGTADASGTAIAQLEFELARAREDLSGMTEQLESAYEEFTASNEEVMSINEELQSANEELETSKEELQSLNEELVTSNQQLETKNQQLEEINADLRNLLASTQIATLFLDEHFCIRRYTPAMAQLMRVIPSDIGRSVEDISCDFDRVALLAQSVRVLEHLAPIETEIRTYDGRWHLCRVLPYRTEDNRIGGVVVTFTDVSVRHRLEVRERLMLALNDRLAELQDPADIVTAVSELIERHLGAAWSRYAPVDSAQQWLYVEGSSVGARVSLTRLPADVLRTLRRGQPLISTGNAGADPGLHAALTTLGAPQQLPGTVLLFAPVVDGRLLTLVGVGHTGVYLWTDEDLDLVSVLAERTWIAIEKIEVNRTLVRRATQLAATDRLKNEFLATLGHELRNPLVPIRSTLDLLLGADQEGQLQAQLQLVDRQVQQLQRLVDDLLDASRIEQIGQIRLRMQDLDLDDVLQMAIEGQQPRFVARRQDFSYLPPSSPLALVGDRVRLVQAVGNLLHNASRYSPAGARIELMAERSGSEAVIRVRDNGRGIAPERLAQLFRLFVHSAPDDPGDSPSEPGSGDDSLSFGLGLVLARRLIELHGGTLTAASPGPGCGSTFTIRLPLDAPADVRPLIAGTAVLPEPLPVVPRRVLLVDDNNDVRTALAALLEAMGHEVCALSDGHEVSDAVGSFGPHTVLLDLAMPKMNGYAVARALRERYPDAVLQLVALTGFGGPDEQQRIREAGFDRHLLKPVSREQLAALLAGEG